MSQVGTLRLVLLVPAPTSLSASKNIFSFSKGHCWDYWNPLPHIMPSLLHTLSLMHPERRLGKHLNICLYSPRCRYWDSRLCVGRWFTDKTCGNISRVCVSVAYIHFLIDTTVIRKWIWSCCIETFAYPDTRRLHSGCGCES